MYRHLKVVANENRQNRRSISLQERVAWPYKTIT